MAGRRIGLEVRNRVVEGADRLLLWAPRVEQGGEHADDDGDERAEQSPATDG